MCCQVTEPAQEGEEPNPEERRVLERKLKKIRRKEEKAQLKAEGKTVEKVAPEKVLPSRQNLDYLTWCVARGPRGHSSVHAGD